MKKKIIYVPRDFKHPARNVLLKDPPDNLIFKFNKKCLNHLSNHNKIKSFRKILLKIKECYTKILDFLNLPGFTLFIPHKRFYFDYCLENFNIILSYKKIIIYQLENIVDLVGYKFKKLNSPLCLLFLKKYLLSNRCKFVFCMSKASKKSVINTLNIPKNKFDKFKVIYPVLKPSKFKRDYDPSIVKLLFVSSIHKSDLGFNFYMKGGKLTLQAFSELKKKYNNIELNYKGYVPKHHKNELKGISGIKFYSYLTNKELSELYKTSDIFIFPTYGDTFGFTFIEAMAYGLPIVTINNNFATPELVLDKISGFVVKSSQKFMKYPFGNIYPKWINEKKWLNNIKKEDDLIGLKNIVRKLELLITNSKLRQEFGKNALKRLIDGDLSVKQRNYKMYELFNK